MAKTKPAASAPEKPGFWITLPGILTGIATVITAVAAVIVALKKEPEKPATVAPAASAPATAIEASDSATIGKAPTSAKVDAKPAQTAPPQTATAGRGGNAVNVSGNGNQVRVGK